MTALLLLLVLVTALTWLGRYAAARLDRPRSVPRSHAVDPDFLPAACRL